MPSTSTRKKFEMSIANWVLGGSLVSAVDKESSNKRGDKKKQRKVLYMNRDGEIYEVVLAEQNSEGAHSGSNTFRFIKIKDGNGGKVRNPNNWKWCAICKVPTKYGALSKMPEGAKWDMCAVCNKDHWINQSAYYHDHDNLDHECHADDESEDKHVKKPEKKKTGKKDGDSKENNDKEDGDKEDGDKEDGDKEDGDKETTEKEGGDAKEKGGDSQEKSNDNDHGSDSWTPDQDKMILDMKSSNKSWKEIATAVNATKGQVTQRFKEIKKQPVTEEATPVVVDDGAVETDLGVNSGGGDSYETPAFLTEGLNAEDAALLKDLDAMLAKSNMKDNFTTVTQGSGGVNNMNMNENHGDVDVGVGVGVSDYQVPNIGSPNVNHNNYAVTNAFEDAAPHGFRMDGKLIPDATWSKSDCELLEHLRDRYQNEKWLHLQANFYNYTGRMVAAEFIERKFEADGAD